MTRDEGVVYTISEVAEILRISRQSVYVNVRKGYIPAAKCGKEYRISEGTLKDILKNGYGRKRQQEAAE